MEVRQFPQLLAGPFPGGVFFRLRELRRGDQITVTRADGSTVRFVVQRTEQTLKWRFPTDEVY